MLLGSQNLDVQPRLNGGYWYTAKYTVLHTELTIVISFGNASKQCKSEYN